MYDIRSTGSISPRRQPNGCRRTSIPTGQASPRSPLFCARRVRDASGGILFSVLPEKSMQKRGAGRERALTREKAYRYILRFTVTFQVKERPSGGVLANSISLVSPQAAGLVRFVVPPFPARTASLGSRGSPAFAIPLKTTKKGADAPFLDHSRGWLVQSTFQNLQNAMQMRIGQTGEVVEILCVCFDFHTSNIQRAYT